MTATPDALDRRLINALQGGFPIVPRPFAAVADALGLDEDEVIGRIAHLVEVGILSRFGPMLDAERLGGAVCLCALAVPAERFEAVAAILADLPAVAHNYERRHALNMWFVLATETPAGIEAAARAVEAATGLTVARFPKEREYFIGMRVEA
ncbi:Lrp/AsnC family transcriptional regulator [Prosthecomicrobium hirschii]|uniref:siroheme decarboxylase n=1 Tax=Prosthecodimorpha hirschii TaxID=665126 RepID=A0A0P6W5P8_9HYPH|nr:AsnC family transcriptional regulator [Prosthecomicrobium hirschii]KPL53810.1 protein nirG [Prosthecomicrobium hirschii]MCW1841294.1 AsnC family transcriptional regulator [Prosthecomicrobium hirschii]